MFIETEITKGLTAEQLNRVVGRINEKIAVLQKDIESYPSTKRAFANQIEAYEYSRFLICLYADATLQFEDLEVAS